jgi:hypothetical protein
MGEKVSEFGSDSWIKSLQNLCFDFLENLRTRPGGRFIHFKDELIGTIEKPGIIVKEYHSSANILKQELFGENAEQSHLDHHKIAALYIRSFLLHNLFIIDIPQETNDKSQCLITKLPNEYFSIVYLATIYKAWNNKFDWSLQMDIKYKFDFIKLLYRYKKDISKLDPLALSNIVYLIEKHFFKQIDQ